MSKKYHVGFIAGTFDILHVGHLNILANCKKHCDKLIVGVCDDGYIKSCKMHNPIMNESDRLRIIQSLRYVDDAIIIGTTLTQDKLKIQKKLHFDVLFSGDDWKNTAIYKRTEKELAQIGVDVVYFPYTKGISSTDIRNKILKNKEN